MPIRSEAMIVATIAMVCSTAAMGIASASAAAPDSSPPSEIEEASLRIAYGINLKRLTEAERRAVDSVCYGIRANRDAYLQCLTDQLTALSNRKSRGKTPIPVSAAVSMPVVVSPRPAQTPARSGVWLWIVGGVAAIVAVAGRFHGEARGDRAGISSSKL